MDKIVVALPGNESLAQRLATDLRAETAVSNMRKFPDSESYVRLDTNCEGNDLIIVATLDRPDDKLLPLVFVCDLVRDLGANRVVLVAPYLAYMRQDTRFQPGEAITSRSFARLLSRTVDALVTVDPHLHRYGSLADLYTVPARVTHAATLVADWIKSEVEDPLLIGPDSESEQWVADVAERAGAPHIVLEKTRHGDRDVEVTVPDIERWRDHRPVLVDDIISTARTMIETVHHLKRAELSAPECIGVHAVFAGDAYKELQAAGVHRVVTSNTIPHESNVIDVSGALSNSVQEIVKD